MRKSFFRWLHEQTESERADLESFLQYKEQLIDYLRQFISELITRGAEIAKRLSTIRDEEFKTLARIAAVEDAGDPRAARKSITRCRLMPAKPSGDTACWDCVAGSAVAAGVRHSLSNCDQQRVPRFLGCFNLRSR